MHINLETKFEEFTEHWHPDIIGELNDNFVMIAKVKGEFVWHHHEFEDEIPVPEKYSLFLKAWNTDEKYSHRGEFRMDLMGQRYLLINIVLKSLT